MRRITSRISRSRSSRYAFSLPLFAVFFGTLSFSLGGAVASGGKERDPSGQARNHDAQVPRLQSVQLSEDSPPGREPSSRGSLGGSPVSLSPPLKGEEGDSVLVLGVAPSFARIPHDGALEPLEGQPFLVSLSFQLASLPRSGERPLLVSKFFGGKAPYPGWALALTQHDTSLRPAFYLRSKSGKGGWFYFDAVNLERGRWFALTVLVSGKDTATLYLQDLSLSKAAPVQFLGGAELGAIGEAATDEPVIFGQIRDGKDSFRGQMVDMLIARPKALPQEMKQAKKFVDGGSGEIHKRLSLDEIQLFVGRKERDEGPLQREVAIGGEAWWQRIESQGAGNLK